jgi:hypothetical protein
MLAAVALLLPGCATPEEPPPPPPAPPPATSLLFEEQRINRAPEEPRDWSQLPDFDRLRESFGDREDFSERCEQGRPARQAFEAIEREAWSEAADLTAPRLETCPVDIDLHLVHAVALRELGQAEASKHHFAWHQGLVDSVLESGDGRTPETAWVVISIAEEYSILNVFGMQPMEQVLLDGGIEMMRVEAEGKTYVVHFDPAAHFRRLQALQDGAE